MGAYTGPIVKNCTDDVLHFFISAGRAIQNNWGFY